MTYEDMMYEKYGMTRHDAAMEDAPMMQDIAPAWCRKCKRLDWELQGEYEPRFFCEHVRGVHEISLSDEKIENCPRVREMMKCEGCSELLIEHEDGEFFLCCVDGCGRKTA